MHFMHFASLRALACIAVSLSFGSSALAQFSSKPKLDRTRLTAAEVEAIDKALESAPTSAAVQGSSANCAPGWVPTFGPQSGLDNVAWAALQHDDGSGDALYIGGGFRSVGAIGAQGIVRWDGVEFSQVDSFPGAWVRALAVYDDGAGPKLYAAGSDGAPLPSGGFAGVVASWDGAQWTSLGGVVDGEILSLAVFDDGSGAKLYAGGEFTTIGGLAAARLARWDGVNWSSVGAAFDAAVLAMTTHDDGGGAQLYVAGSFTLPGGSPGDHVARFDGALWSDIGTGDIAGPIRSLASFDDGAGATLWIGGQFAAPSVGVNRLARWTAGAWSQGAPWSGPGSVNALTVHDDGAGAKLYAGGQFSFPAGGAFVGNVIRRSNGQWDVLGAGLNGAVHTVASTSVPGGARLFAGGQFSAANDPSGGDPTSTPRAAVWDGTRWTWPTPQSQSPGGLDSPLLALGRYTDAGGDLLVAQGVFTVGAAQTLVAGVALRRNDSWELLPEITSGVLVFESHDAGAGSELFAATETLISAAGISLGRVARFDGVDWQAVGAPGLNNAVYALHSFDDGSGSALYAGGAFTQAARSRRRARRRCCMSRAGMARNGNPSAQDCRRSRRSPRLRCTTTEADRRSTRAEPRSVRARRL